MTHPRPCTGTVNACCVGCRGLSCDSTCHVGPPTPEVLAGALAELREAERRLSRIVGGCIYPPFREIGEEAREALVAVEHAAKVLARVPRPEPACPHSSIVKMDGQAGWFCAGCGLLGKGPDSPVAAAMAQKLADADPDGLVVLVGPPGAKRCQHNRLVRANAGARWACQDCGPT